MTQSESTKLALVMNDVKHIKQSVSRIEKALTNHVKWEETKYDDMEHRFAPKKLEHDVELNQSNIQALSKEVGDLPQKLRTVFANIWTEQVMKGVLISALGAAMISIIVRVLK